MSSLTQESLDAAVAQIIAARTAPATPPAPPLPPIEQWLDKPWHWRWLPEATQARLREMARGPK